MISMALTLKSLASAARRRVQLAQAHVGIAHEQLGLANSELEEAIPSGNVERIRGAHERTQRAEEAVFQATGELEVAGELLAEDAQAPARGEASPSGMGVRSLLDTLRRKQ